MRSPGAAFDLRAAMTDELKAALRELEASATPGKAVHRCRVHLKRARAMGKIGKVAAPGLAAVFNESARGLMRQLAEMRDLYALVDTARMLAESVDPESAVGLTNAADALEARRQALDEIDIEAIRAGVRDLLALAQVWPQPSPRQLRAGAQRILKRARRARRRGLKTGDHTIRHTWRKREKDRLFAASALDKAWPARRKRKHSAAVGHLLGQERDARLLHKRLKTEPSLAGDAIAAGRAKRVLRRYWTRARRRADRLGAHLEAAGA